VRRPFARIENCRLSIVSGHMADDAAETIRMVTPTIYLRRPSRPTNDPAAKAKRLQHHVLVSNLHRSQRGGRRFDPGLVHQTTLLCESRMLHPAFGVMRPEELVFILANSARRGIREPSVVDSIRKPRSRSPSRRAGRSVIRVAVEARARQLLWHFNE